MVKNLSTIDRSEKIRLGKNTSDYQPENTIVLNATPEVFPSLTANSFYVAPLRYDFDQRATSNTIVYNFVTKEIVDIGPGSRVSLEDVLITGNVTTNTAVFNNTFTGLVTLSNVGIGNANPIHLLDVGNNFNVNEGGDVWIGGELFVEGNTSTINTQNLTIKDPIIELARNNPGINDIGVMMTRTVVGSNVGVIFKESSDELSFGYTQSNASAQNIAFSTSTPLKTKFYGNTYTTGSTHIGRWYMNESQTPTQTITYNSSNVSVTSPVTGTLNMTIQSTQLGFGNELIVTINGTQVGIVNDTSPGPVTITEEVIKGDVIVINTNFGFGFVISNYTISYINTVFSLTTYDETNAIAIYDASKFGILQDIPTHTLDVGSNLYVQDSGTSNVLGVTGNAYISGDLTVGGDVTFSNDFVVVQNLTSSNNITATANIDVGYDLNVTGNAFISSNVVVTGNTDVRSELNVDGNVFVSSNVIVSGNTDVQSELNVDGNVFVTGNTDISSELNVSGNVFVSSNAIITGNTDVQSELNVDGNVFVVSNVIVTGNTDVRSALNVDGNVFVGSNVIVTGNTDISSELNVTGNVFVSSNAVITGNTDIQSELNVDGNVFVASNVIVSGNTDIQSELNVDGNVFVASNVIVSGNTDISSELNVTGNVFVASNVIVSGNTDIESELNVTGNVFVASNVVVTGNTDVQSELNVSGNVFVLSNAVITGNTDISSELNVSGNVFVLSNVVITGNTDVESELNVTGNVFVDSNVVVTNNVHAARYYGDGGHLANVTLQVVSDKGNTTSNTIQFTNATTALTTDLNSNVGIKVDQLANVVITSPEADHLLVYDGSNWVNDFNLHNFIKVHNTTGGTLYRGNAVYIVDSFNNNVANVALAKSDSASTMPTIGLIHEDILDGAEGVAVAYGKVNGINTLGCTEGDTVYVSNVGAGLVMQTKPYGLNDQIQNVGVCIKAHESNGVIFVTGVGRSNDIPNAPIETTTSPYVYVNTADNNLRKIVPSNLLTKLQTLEQVTNTGNTTSNTIQFTNATTGLVTTANLEVGSNISVLGLADSTNKYLPMVDTDGTFIHSPVFVTPEGKYVISASEAEFLGNITLGGNTTIISSTSVTIEDRIFGVGANNSVTGLDSGFMIEHQHEAGDYANIALIHHASDHRFAIGYTQNTFTDDHILYYQYPSRNLLVDLQGDVNVQNTLSVGQTMTVTGASTLKDDLTVGLVSNLFVDVSTSRVGINEASPEKSLDVNGTGRFKDTTDSTTTSTGALIVSGGLGVASNIHSTNVYATTHMAVGTSPTSVPLEVRAS